MSKIRLVRHPDMPSVSISSVEAEIARVEEGMFVIRYSAIGDLSKLRIPEPVRYSTRHDELWRTTCFEALVTSVDDGSYLEFNFAPSTGWAAYRFDNYRAGRAELPLPAPHFDVERLPDRLHLTVAVDTTELRDLAVDRPWRFNLSAVIEDSNGNISYWALAHGAGPPDFHNPACFAYHLPPFEPA